MDNVNLDIEAIKNNNYKPSLYKYYSLIEKVNNLSEYFKPDICFFIDMSKKAIQNNYELMLKENYEYQEELFFIRQKS